MSWIHLSWWFNCNESVLPPNFTALIDINIYFLKNLFETRMCSWSGLLLQTVCVCHDSQLQMDGKLKKKKKKKSAKVLDHLQPPEQLHCPVWKQLHLLCFTHLIRFFFNLSPVCLSSVPVFQCMITLNVCLHYFCVSVFPVDLLTALNDWEAVWYTGLKQTKSSHLLCLMTAVNL